MAFESNPGVNRLARALSGRMSSESDSPLVIDFGEIQADGSLLTNTFPKPIPKGDYSVLRQCMLGSSGDGLTVTEMEGEPDSGTDIGQGEGEDAGAVPPHTHKVPLPESMRSVGAGDRVLVAWVNSEAVVLDIVMGS